MYNLLDKGLFLKNRPRLVKKGSVRPSSRLKTVDLDCRSSLSVAQLVRFWFKSLQSLTVHDRQFLQGNLFLLAVCTHDVGLYLCSIFCIRSLLQFSAASYRAFGARNTPQLYPITLRQSDQQVQWPSAVLILVLVLVQFTWMMLTVLAVKVISLSVHVAPMSHVPVVTHRMLE